MLEFGPPAIDIVLPMPYVASEQILDGATPEPGEAVLLEQLLERCRSVCSSAPKDSPSSSRSGALRKVSRPDGSQAAIPSPTAEPVETA